MTFPVRGRCRRGSTRSFGGQSLRIRAFGYGPSDMERAGRKGLLNAKNLVVIPSRAASYPAGTDNATTDFQQPHLRLRMAFIGGTEVTFIPAENQRRARASAESSRIAAAAILCGGGTRQSRLFPSPFRQGRKEQRDLVGVRQGFLMTPRSFTFWTSAASRMTRKLLKM
jgi:hypothetical protein